MQQTEQNQAAFAPGFQFDRCNAGDELGRTRRQLDSVTLVPRQVRQDVIT